ncbi:flagellar hook-associated protein FlgK [Terasakiella sp.]|uniref:flagellar hook-associated protein FlgK n=1 Tax=Terasakiella sp. TaxID=2034861 RepID=UPI003AA98016
MDIRSAYSAALSSLNATQYASSITSTNIANANVEGYSAQRVNTATTYSDGSAVGVGVSSVSAYVNENLFKSYVSAVSQTTYAQTTADHLSQLLDQYGAVDSGSALADLITDLETALADLSVTPESQTVKNTVLNAADQLASTLNDLSSDVQQQRENVDGDIENAVTTVNQALTEIEDLNREISVKTALGENTSALEDARAQALLTVSENMNVSYFTTNTNELHVYTTGGLPLVDSRAHELSYESTNNVNAVTSFDDITLDGRDVTNQLSGGTIGALVDLRDETIPARQEELDALAGALADTLNAVLNTGTPFPPQNSITGQEVFDGSDAFSASGTFRIVLSDADGETQSVTDLDLSTYAMVSDLAAALDGIAGVSASIDANGHLTILSDDPDLGIALSEMDSEVGSDAQGVSDYFGLNDLFIGDDAGSIKVRDELLDDPSLLSCGKLSQDATLSVGDVALTSGDASVALALQEAMNTTIDFADAGAMGATTLTLADYSAELLSSFALEVSSVETQAETKGLISETLASDISNESGVNLDEEAARLTVLENQYSASAQVIQTLNDMFSSLISAVA